MNLFFTWFQDPKRPDFKRLKNVFIKSLQKHSPNIKLEEHLTEYPKKENFKTSSPSHFENIYKLNIWNEQVQKAKEPLILSDCDMIILKDISVLKDMDLKDITLTMRKEYSKVNCNAGFIYVKPTEKAKEFFQEWTNLSIKEFDPNRNPKWKNLYRTYLGATQTTLGYLREEGKYEDYISEIPCHIWNATRLDWHLINDDTKIIHIKSYLRKHILKNKKVELSPKLKEVVKIWQEYERN